MIHKQPLSEDVAAFVRENIVSGRLRSGSFVRIATLADELGLSATPVREALHLLRAQGFVELDPNKGFRVTPLSAPDVIDIFDLLSFIAGELCARAAVKMSDEALSELAQLQCNLAIQSAANNFGEVERLNDSMHRLINISAQSPKLQGFIKMLNLYVPHRFYPAIPGWPAASLEDHAEVLQALQHRDPAAARATMAQHMRHAGELLAANLESASRDGSEARPESVSGIG